jgi:hypothetical protein
MDKCNCAKCVKRRRASVVKWKNSVKILKDNKFIFDLCMAA